MLRSKLKKIANLYVFDGMIGKFRSGLRAILAKKEPRHDRIAPLARFCHHRDPPRL